MRHRLVLAATTMAVLASLVFGQSRSRLNPVIAQLEQQRLRDRAARAAAVSAGKGALIAATSPVYQKLRVSLAETEAQVASLRSQLGFKQVELMAAWRPAFPFKPFGDGGLELQAAGTLWLRE